VALTVLPSAFPSTDEKPSPKVKTVSATNPAYHVRSEYARIISFGLSFTECATFHVAHPSAEARRWSRAGIGGGDVLA
jgi:hypothetical protein